MEKGFHLFPHTLQFTRWPAGRVERDGFRRNCTPGTGPIVIRRVRKYRGVSAPGASSCGECGFHIGGRRRIPLPPYAIARGQGLPRYQSVLPVSQHCLNHVQGMCLRCISPDGALSSRGMPLYSSGSGEKPPLPTLPSPSSREMPQPLQRLRRSPLLL